MDEFVSEILTNNFLQKYVNKPVPWGFNGLGYIVYKRTYSRLKKDGSNEEWWETIARCINGAQKIGARYTKEEAETLYDLIFNLKCNYPGRMLWQLGTETVDRFGSNSLVNCWMATMNEPKAFLFLFENLMLGGGVGFSVKREHVHELPKIKLGVKIEHKPTKDADFIVPDSREGWVKLLENILKSFFETGDSFSYSTILVRGAGERIGGFGGTASGPNILINGMKNIITVFQSREGKKLRSIDVLDVCNIIGSIVVAGNVRRSAEISLGDPDDYLYLKAKRWDLGNIPNWRAMSNNSLYIDDFTHISNDVWDGYNGNGEPYGFFNLPLCQKYGRISDGPMKDSEIYPTDKDECEGVNPCGELPLESYECCNLAEIYLNNIQTEDELITASKLLYKTQKAVSANKFIHSETNKVVKKNMRLGLGVTGICQSQEKLKWLDSCYKELRAFDKIWSKTLGVNESIKLTTTKPSGSVSLLAGSTPGIHPGYSRYYIRRIRMSSSDPLVKQCRDANYHIEYAVNFDQTEDHSTVVVSFPCDVGEKAILTKDFSAIQQLELVKQIQSVWADNAVSCTVYFKKEELDGIKQWLAKNYKTGIKSVSFLLHSDHGFKQAPYTEISKEEYEKLVSQVKPISSFIVKSGDMISGIECEGGACPIR